MQALAHLGAAVVHQHRPVLVDVDEGAALVEGGEVEGDAELHRRERQRPLGVRVRGVEGRDLLEASLDVRLVVELLPRGGQPLGVPDRLAVRRLLAVDVEAAPTHLARVEPDQRRTASDDVLDDQHALRAAEASERRLGGLVRVGHAAVEAYVRQPVGVVDVAQRPGQDRLGQVQAPPAVGGEGRVEGEQPALGVEARAPLGVERRGACRSSSRPAGGSAGPARDDR